MTFTTKKTRAISAFAAILMLLSLMTCFVLPVSAADEGTYTIYRELQMNGQKVMDLPAIEGIAPGTEIAAANLELAGYLLTDDSLLQEMGGKYYMPGKDITLVYTNTVVDLDPLTTVLALLNQYDRTLFTVDPGAAIEAYLAELKAQGVVDGMAKDQLTLSYLNEDIAELVVAADFANLKLKNVAPLLPNYADKDLYAGFALATGSKLAGYAITDADDWFAILKDAQMSNLDFAGMNFYLRNDVDLGKFEGLGDLKEILPVFAGTLDGCGHSFKNVAINEAVRNAPVGLIGVLAGTGVVKNLGIADGVVVSAYRAADNSYGVAAVVGKAEAGAKISKVWNAADVKVTGAYGETEGVAKKDYPVAGIVGVAEAGVKINGCYNLGVISGGDRVAELANGAAVVTNSYAAGANALAEAVTVENTRRLDAADPYAFAHQMNAGYVASDENVAYTVENDTVTLVFDNDKSIVKVTVDTINNSGVAANFDFDYSFYAYADSLVKLEASYASGAYEIASGDAEIVSGDHLQLNKTDVVVRVEIAPLNSDGLMAALEYYAGKDASAFENVDALSAALARARKNNYANAGAMAADVAILNANQGLYTTSAPANLPAVSEMAVYPDAVAYGYTIRSVDDLKLVAAAPAVAYGKLYLSNDLDLAGETFGGLNDLTVAFDGLGNTISGWIGADGGFFDGFAGGTIENVTFSGAQTEGAAILINETAEAVALNNVHVKLAVIEKADTLDLGFLIGKATAKVTITDSSVLESTMTASNGVYKKNHGILIGNATEVELKNIIATGNTITGVSLNSGAGLLVANAADMKAENIAVTYNNINVKATSAQGMALISNDADAVVENIYAEGNAVNYDGLGQGGAIALLNVGNAAKATVYADAKTALPAMNSAVSDINGYAAWTLDATYKTPTLVMDGRAPSYTVTFKVGSLIVDIYPTDEFGHLFNYKNSDPISKYTWPEIHVLAAHVFTADAELTAEAAVDHISVEVVGTPTTDAPANVQVKLHSNPGLRAVTFKVTFDSANFQLISAVNGELFESFEAGPDADGSFNVTVWDNAIVSGDGVVLKLVLAAKNGVGDYADAVTVEVVEARDSFYNPVAFDTESVDITVAQGILWGDADADGSVTSADVTMMLQYIVGKIDAVNNPAAVELDGVSGLSVVDAQIIFHALANNLEGSIKPLTVA